MVKFTPAQLNELLGIKCGKKLAKDIEPYYGLKLTLKPDDKGDKTPLYEVYSRAQLLSAKALQINFDCLDLLKHPNERNGFGSISSEVNPIHCNFNNFESTLEREELEISWKILWQVTRSTLP